MGDGVNEKEGEETLVKCLICCQVVVVLKMCLIALIHEFEYGPAPRWSHSSSDHVMTSVFHWGCFHFRFFVFYLYSCALKINND